MCLERARFGFPVSVSGNAGVSPTEVEHRIVNSNRFIIKIAFGLIALGLFLAGCKGVPTKGEKEARQQAKAIAQNYRPEGQKPALPILTSDSSLSNYLAFAMLNQPQVIRWSFWTSRTSSLP